MSVINKCLNCTKDPSECDKCDLGEITEEEKHILDQVIKPVRKTKYKTNYNKERYATDEKFREKIKKYNLERYHKKKKKEERGIGTKEIDNEKK